MTAAGPARAGRGGGRVAGRVGGLLLAAGAGTRFGEAKAAVRLPVAGDAGGQGEALAERGVRLLAGAGCAPVVVALGADAQRVQRRTDLRPARVVVVEDWQEGMGASLRAGLIALQGECDAVVVALADQPLVAGEVITRLRAAWTAGASAAVAVYGGVRGTPALFDASVWSDVRASAVGDRGARAWLRANPGRVAAVECGDVAHPHDVDTPQDLQTVRTLLDGG